jgi:hypothetical protein
MPLKGLGVWAAIDCWAELHITAAAMEAIRIDALRNMVQTPSHEGLPEQTATIRRAANCGCIFVYSAVTPAWKNSSEDGMDRAFVIVALKTFFYTWGVS